MTDAPKETPAQGDLHCQCCVDARAYALTVDAEVQFVRDCVASVIGDPAHATQVRFYLEGKSMTSWFVGMVMARVGASSRVMSPALVRIIATEVKAALDLLVDASRKETP